MGLLEGDTALVTGAASGIGRGIARALAAEGARLVLSDIAEEAGASTGARAQCGIRDSRPCRSVGGAQAVRRRRESAGLDLDLRAQRRAEAARERDGLAVTESEWDAMVNVGLRSGFVLGQAAGAHMTASKIRGRMLFVTSLHAYTPRNLPHYSATKAGQTMLVKELARALGAAGIRVNAIAPGAIPGGGFEADTAALEKMIPLGRTGTPARYRRHGGGAAVRPLLPLCHGDHRRGGRRTGALQLDPVSARLDRWNIHCDPGHRRNAAIR